MIKINLLPFRTARKKENIRQQVMIFLLSVVLVLTLMYGYGTMLSGDIAALESNIEMASSELVTYQQVIRRVKEYENTLRQLMQKNSAIKELELGRAGPVTTMNAMTQCIVPQMMWLTSMSEKDGFLNINGIAVDNATIAHFMERLEESPCFIDVDLQSSQQTEFADTLKVKVFRIKCKPVNPWMQASPQGAT
jgi:type IV pilus assembly protein PilN